MNNKQITIPVILVSLPYIFFDVLMPIYSKELGYSTLQMTILFSIYSLSVLLMRFILGKWSDNYSHHLIFLAALLFFVGAYFALSVASWLPALLFARVLQGVANVLLTISIFGIISGENKSRAQNLGRFDSYKNLGGLLGVGLSFLILEKYELLKGWKLLLACCGAAATIAFIYSLTNRKSRTKRDFRSQGVILSSEKRKIWFFKMLFSFSYSMISVIFIPYLQSIFNADIRKIAIAFLLPMFVSSFLGSFLGKVGDRIGYRKAVVLSAIICALSIVAIIFSVNLNSFALLWTLFISSFSLLSFSIDAMYMKGIPEDSTGDASGKYSIGSNIGMIFGPILGGILFDTFGYTMPYIVFVIIMALLILLFIIISSNKYFNPEGHKISNNF